MDSTFIIFGSKYLRDFLFGTVLLYFFCYTCQQYTKRNGTFLIIQPQLVYGRVESSEIRILSVPTSFIIELEPILIDKIIIFWTKLIYGTIIKDSTFIILGQKYKTGLLL